MLCTFNESVLTRQLRRRELLVRKSPVDESHIASFSYERLTIARKAGFSRTAKEISK